jgi:hypothetical protein
LTQCSAKLAEDSACEAKFAEELQDLGCYQAGHAEEMPQMGWKISKFAAHFKQYAEQLAGHAEESTGQGEDFSQVQSWTGVRAWPG